jgi:hypothetical protein
MFGIADKAVFLAYALSVASALLCVLYGVAHWNQGDEPPQTEDLQWAKEEKEEVEETL